MSDSQQKTSGKSPVIPDGLFSSPLEDTSGLDVFAQIAASIPLESTTASIMNISPPVRRYSSADIVHQSQSQLAQSIYQAQQALRQQQRRASTVTTASNASSSYSDFDDLDEDMDEDDEYELDAGGAADGFEKSPSFYHQHNRSAAAATFLHQTIHEESESDLAMSLDSATSSSAFTASSSASVASAPPSLRRASLPVNAYHNDLTQSTLSNRRIVHNICERKRRENIREGFARLQSRLPKADSDGVSKLSKMEILQGALEVIEGLRERIKSLQEECAALQVMSEQ